MELTVVRNTALNLSGGLGSFFFLYQEESLLPKSRRKGEDRGCYEIHFSKQWKQWVELAHQTFSRAYLNS